MPRVWSDFVLFQIVLVLLATLVCTSSSNESSKQRSRRGLIQDAVRLADVALSGFPSPGPSSAMMNDEYGPPPPQSFGSEMFDRSEMPANLPQPMPLMQGGGSNQMYPAECRRRIINLLRDYDLNEQFYECDIDRVHRYPHQNRFELNACLSRIEYNYPFDFRILKSLLREYINLGYCN